MRLKVASLLALSVVLTGCLCPVTAATDPVARAQSHVQIGSRRDEAVQILSDAWFHSECRHPSTEFTDEWIEDLFFYGPRDRDRVVIVVVRSETVVNGELEVVLVGSVEGYMLHLYDQCEPNPLQPFGEATPAATGLP